MEKLQLTAALEPPEPELEPELEDAEDEEEVDDEDELSDELWELLSDFFAATLPLSGVLFAPSTLVEPERESVR